MTLSFKEPAMRRNVKRYLGLMLVLPALALVFAQCEKEPEEFGEQIMHPDDSIKARFDTTYIMDSRVVRSDSFSTLYHFFDTPDYITEYSDMLIGGYVDPHFGSFKASFITQIGKSDSINFDEVPLQVEGANLYFHIKKIYPEIPSDAEMHVYKINKDLRIDNPYYNNIDPLEFYDPANKISESTEFIGDSIIKVKLTHDFATFLTTADDTTMADVGDFKDFFPGIYAEMAFPQGEGFINKLHLTSDTSHLELSFKEIDSEEAPDTLEYPINQGAIRFNLFKHDYQTASFPVVNANHFLNNDEAKNDSILLISGLGGTRAKLTLPEDIKQRFKQDSNFLARAEIVVKPIKQYNDFLFPDAVSMYTYANDTTYVNISDNNFFNGKYDEDANLYSCNITSFVQAYIEGDAGNSVYLHVPNPRFEPGQLIVTGTGHPNPIKLKIKYFKP